MAGDYLDRQQFSEQMLPRTQRSTLYITNELPAQQVIEEAQEWCGIKANEIVFYYGRSKDKITKVGPKCMPSENTSITWQMPS